MKHISHNGIDLSISDYVYQIGIVDDSPHIFKYKVIKLSSVNDKIDVIRLKIFNHDPEPATLTLESKNVSTDIDNLINIWHSKFINYTRVLENCLTDIENQPFFKAALDTIDIEETAI